MNISYPQYIAKDKLVVTYPIAHKLISSIRIYLLKQITCIPMLSPVIANIKSPLITNTRHFGRLTSGKNNKKKLTSLYSDHKVHKGSDSNSSSISLYKESIPTKIDVFDKKQQRWAIKNGIAIHSKKINSPKTKNKFTLHIFLGICQTPYEIHHSHRRLKCLQGHRI